MEHCAGRAMDLGGAQITEVESMQRESQIEWAKDMRRQFSPTGMVAENGSINQDFFKPTQVVVLDAKKWGPEERERLYQGIETYGIGKWREIGENLLPKWDDQALRIKASRIMGTQSLARYVGWRGNREAIDAEFEKNRKVGEKTGCWKAGLLVEDDNGSVKKALEQSEVRYT